MKMLPRLQNNHTLMVQIKRALHGRIQGRPIFPAEDIDWETAAGVLMLLGSKPDETPAEAQPCIVLNKRSTRVRQPGDLCFPGGSMAPSIDPYLALLLALPVASLGRWQQWAGWKKNHSRQSKLMSIIWATGLRESFEEMRLNPFGVRFLGPLRPQSLVMFQRTIYPMVGWIKRQKRFFPNWEVEKVVYVPLRDLLDPNLHGRYRLRMEGPAGRSPAGAVQDFPCVRIPAENPNEILWGATYRITMDFLELVFGFMPPAIETLPVVKGTLDETYLTGQT